MDFTAAATNDTAVKIGESNQSANKVGINVTASGQLPSASKVRVTVTVGCGAKEADLLASQNESLTVTGPFTPVPTPPAGKKAWNTGAFPIALPVSISLENFVSNTPPGGATIGVLVENSTGPRQWSKGEDSSIAVKKVLEPRANPEIRYFTVNPNYILHAGQTKVAVSFCATGYETLTLFRNNEEVKNWDGQLRPPSDPVVDAFPDTPSITSVYRLEGKYTKQEDKKRDALDRTVQVISPGWNQITLPQGAPVRLFVANDFSGSGADRLYGIFKDEGGAYGLYSSATGVDAWRLEPGDIPQDMATSPCVYYKNKLWLIGGSSVYDNRPRKEVWCYEPDQSRGSRGWKRKDDFASDMPARMGHACVLFKDTVWVIGGYNNGTAYRDVWQGAEKEDGQLGWSLLKNQCEWAGRLNPAAATWRKRDGSPEVWIYGGSKEPISDDPMNDFWSTSDGKTWEKMDRQSPPVPIMPDPGAPIASALVAFAQADSSGTTKPDRLFLMGSFKELGNRIFSFLFEWHPGTGFWEGRPVIDGWQQFQGQTIYMQAVVFNRFLFCWSLHPDSKFVGKLNILVSR